MPAIPPLPSRHVRRLHVRASAEDDARHAATLLGDALRTASLGVADEGRFIVIRRLPLGRISARVSAASLALQIERIAAEVMADAVACDVPAAGEANAVRFANRGEAIVTLARSHAAGMSAAEWFWPEVVPGWRAALSRTAKWTLLLEAAHGTPESAIVAAAVVERAIAAGVVDEILSEVSQRQAMRWLQLEGWSSKAPAAAGPLWRRPGGERGETLRRWRTSWEVADARLVWLATLMSVIEHPGCAADPKLPGRIAFALSSLDASEATWPGERLPAIDAEGESRSVTGIEPRRTRISSTETGLAISDRRGLEIDGKRAGPTALPELPPVEMRPQARPASIAPRAQVEADDVAAQPVEESARSFVAATTVFGGVLFLVRVLEQLGFSAFLAEHPALLQSAFPVRLLRTMGQRAGMPESDPLAIAFGAGSGADSDVAAGFALDAAPFELPAAVRVVLASPASRASIETPADAWMVAVRRWCRRHPRVGLSTLLRRRATVQISRTHIDATFSLSDLDVRVRRWALDVDPGWVPWLGRVVTFTYGNTHGAR